MSSPLPMDLSTALPANRRWRRFDRIFVVLIALAFLAQGCTLSPHRPDPASLQASPFLPATQPAALTLQPSATASSTETVAPTLTCQDNLSFTNDLTIQDGSSVTPGATLDKRWEVRNTGSCNWDERYSLRLIAGDPLGAKEQQALFPALSGASVVIRIEFKAPMQAGNYRSSWQAYNPAGEPFGEPIFITIIVTN